MTKWIALAMVTALALACGKKAAPPTGEAPAATAGAAAPSAVDRAAASVSPPDPERTAAAAAATEVTALHVRSAASNAAAGAAGARVGRVIDAAAEAFRAVPRDAWDPAAVVAAVGKDRTALFHWVRDRTALVPYRGSLRGAVGVMMDRVGNSLDRALLLAELLRQAGLEVRLASARLEPDALRDLTARWSTRARPALPAAAPATLPAADATLAAMIQAAGLDAAALAPTLARADATQRALITRTRTRIAEQTAALGKLVPAPTDQAAAPGDADSAFADHWWVQVRDGDGDSDVWSDLDPSLPDATPGQPLAALAGATVAPDALDPELRHTLTVRVIGEVWHGAMRDEPVLLEHTFAPSQFYGQRLSIVNAPIDMPDDDTLIASADPAGATRAALIAQTEWVPVLQVNGHPIVKQSVTDGGELHDVTDANANTTRLARAVQRATKAGAGGASDLLGALPDDTSDGDAPAPAPTPAPAGHAGFTAEWIELEIRSPGAAPVTARRVVFDALSLPGDRSAARPIALSAAARLDRGLALVGETELLPMFARIPETFVTQRAIAALVASRAVLVEVAGLKGAPSKDLRTRFAGSLQLPGTLYALALGRFAWSSVSDQVYLDRLDVLSQRKQVIANGATLRTRTTVDIIGNAVAVWPTAGTDPRAVRIAQGVADTAAEAIAIDCPPATCSRGANTSDLFAAPAGKRWTAVAATSIAPEARALATADHAAGYTLIGAPGASTWWRVQPLTGETLGMSPAGGGVTGETIVQMIVTGINGVGCFVNMTPPPSQHGLQLVACIAGSGFGFIGSLVGTLGKAYQIAGWAMVIIGAVTSNVGPHL